MVLLWGFLKFLCWGCLYATSRWTLTTTLFRAIKRINLSRGSKLAFTSTSEDWLFLRIFKTLDITRVSCVIYFLCLFYYCFYLLVGFFITPVTWRFLLMYFLFKVSASFLIFILAVVFFIVSFSRVYYLGFVLSLVSWLLDSIL